MPDIRKELRAPVAEEARDRFVDYYAEQSQSARDPGAFPCHSRRRHALPRLAPDSPTTRSRTSRTSAAARERRALMWAVEGDPRPRHGHQREARRAGAHARASRGQRGLPHRIGDATAMGVGLRWTCVSCRSCSSTSPTGSRCLDEAGACAPVRTARCMSARPTGCVRNSRSSSCRCTPGIRRALKRHYEKLAVTTRRELVNHAQYPAVHWFSFFGLRRALLARGMRDDVGSFRRHGSRVEGRFEQSRWSQRSVRSIRCACWRTSRRPYTVRRRGEMIVACVIEHRMLMLVCSAAINQREEGAVLYVKSKNMRRRSPFLRLCACVCHTIQLRCRPGLRNSTHECDDGRLENITVKSRHAF